MSWIRNNEWLSPDSDHRVRWPEIRRFLGNYRPFRTPLAAAGLLALLGSATAFLIPLIFYRLQLALSAGDWTMGSLAMLGFLAIALVEAATTYGIRVIRSWISTRLNRGLVIQYYGKLLNVAVEDFIAFRQRTNLFQRVVDAMSITPQFTDVLVRGGQSVIVLVVVGAAVATVSPSVLVVLSTGAVLLFVYALLRARELRELRQHTLALNYPLVGKMTEVIGGLFTIKALAASLRVTRDVSDLVDRKTDAEYAESRAEAGMLQFAQAIRQLTLVFAMGQALVLLYRSELSFADLISVYVLAGIFLQPVSDLATLFQSLSRLSVNVANFYQVVDLPDEAGEAGIAAAARAASPERPGVGPRVQAGLELAGAPGRNGSHGRENGRERAHAAVVGGSVRPAAVAAPLPPRGQVSFSDVEFAYRGGSPVIRGLDLEIRPGEKICLIGRSGVGKTTLLRLLLGFLQPQRGSITLDGQDVASLPDKNAYRRHFGVVSQHDVLFAVSIRENLTFGLEDEPIPEERLEEALRMVSLWEPVARLPKGLDATYSEDLFSGGERQRFFIARALLRRPAVVLLDEPTSALDFQSESRVMEAIERLVGGKTTITIAHRLSTVRNADRVVVMDEGIVHGIGPHEALYNSNQYYRALCDYNSFVV